VISNSPKETETPLNIRAVPGVPITPRP